MGRVSPRWSVAGASSGGILFRAGLEEAIAAGKAVLGVCLGAQQIALGDAEVILAGGMENMTRVPYLLPDMRLGHRLGNSEVVDAMYRDGLLDPLCGLIMGETAENLVDMYDIGREEQDAWALRSQRTYARAKTSPVCHVDTGRLANR